jgi:FkbM family methyltransferase
MHVLVRIQNFLISKYFRLTFGNRSRNSNLVRLGTTYGGWWVPKNMVEMKSTNWAVISVGLGHDVTFDKEILKCGISVIGLDPLDDCIQYAKNEIGSNEKFFAIKKGLWTHSGEIIFYPPKNSSHDSWSIANSQSTETSDSKIFEVTSLSDIEEAYETILHDKKIYLKMDIEGSEMEIIDYIVEKKKRYDFLAIEMDYLSLIPFFSISRRFKAIKKAKSQLKSLSTIGYQLTHVENFNFFWSLRTNV